MSVFVFSQFSDRLFNQQLFFKLLRYSLLAWCGARVEEDRIPLWGSIAPKMTYLITVHSPCKNAGPVLLKHVYVPSPFSTDDVFR